MDNTKTPDLTKSCRERNDHFQNCDTCPDGSCGDNTNPKANPLYYTQEEMDELDSATYELVEAVESGEYQAASDAVRLLETDIHWKDEWAFRYAADVGDIEIVMLLVEDGADIHAMNDQAIKLARENNHTKVVEYLESKGEKKMKTPDPIDCGTDEEDNGNVLGLSQKDTIKLIISLLISLLTRMEL